MVKRVLNDLSRKLDRSKQQTHGYDLFYFVNIIILVIPLVVDSPSFINAIKSIKLKNIRKYDKVKLS